MKLSYTLTLTLLLLCVILGFTQEDMVDSLEYIESDHQYIEDEYSDDEDLIEDSRSYISDINFSIKVPTDQMSKKFNNLFYGGEINFYGQLKKTSPLYIGGSIFYDRYASNSISYYDFSANDGNEYEFTESFGGNVLGFDLGLKYFSKNSFWIFNPYIQFNLEYRRGYGVINITNVDLGETESTKFKGGNSSFGYDIGVGSLVLLKSEEYSLNIKLSYTSGGGLFLYKSNNKSNVYSVLDYYDFTYTQIGLISIKFGITFM